MPDQPVIIREVDARPRGKGCFFWGCLSLVIIFLLMGGCTAIVVFTLVNKAKELTDTVPAPVPPHEAAPGDLQEIERRLEAFEKAPSPAEIEITAEDLNDLIASEREFTGNVFARIEGGKVYFDASFPLSQFPPPISTLLGDRYFNGTLGVDLLIENQQLVARPISAETAKNQKVSSDDLDNLNRISGDILEEFLGRRLLEATKIAKDVEVKEGRIVVKK